jgi:dihydropyrimidinase
VRAATLVLPVSCTHGVLEGRLSNEELCMELSTNPAKIMGLYPRKGAIEVGADADLAIIHPKNRTRGDCRPGRLAGKNVYKGRKEGERDECLG